ncbi:MAG: Mor transcription activator family protein [Hydrogenophaga sp.]|uniref:Mor transcription activator family protein n=1 Tax=Hydrogenophaga sp. TaxID=1904254 RepID=UPI002722D20F|nr:Mor transcription activator family protein [Hydrogenophaga sp.]MDO9568078.1 Mor transcription activator family protein [Hydrogenophaga sp.]
MEHCSIDQLARVLDDNAEELPPTLRGIVELIGPLATAKLVDRFGGLRLYIPGKAATDHPVAELIGFDNMRKLCDEYKYEGTGMRITIPCASGVILAERNKRIRAEYGPKSTRQLAIEHRVSERQIERIVSPKNGSVGEPNTKVRSSSLVVLPWPSRVPTTWVEDAS